METTNSREGVMTYRERQALKAERLRNWADKREVKADQAYAGVNAITERIPFGQPILVGHHSESGARADQRRIQSGMDKFCEHNAKATEMRQRADGIERGARSAIYSDDDNALEMLQAKLAKLEAQREAIKTRNAEYRKAHKDELKALTAYGRDMAMPHRKYELTNLGGVISNTRKRIDELSAPEMGRVMTSRYPGECRECGAAIEAGETITYYRRSHSVSCKDCS